MTSVVIAAHNEANVIGSCLDALAAQRFSGPVDIVVSANGCTDDTAAVAARAGVTVVDRAEAGKAAALNAGDRAATGFPRIYLDADIVVPPHGLATLEARFDVLPRPLAVVPRRRVDTAGRPWPVRAYFSINALHPAFRTGLFGRGMIALSEAGRARFDDFPMLIADDLFLDSRFTAAEKAEVSDVEVVVEAPRTTRDLVHRLVRVRRGNAQLRAAAAAGQVDLPVRPADRWAWLRDVVVREPRRAPAAIPYLVITIVAALLARRPVKAGDGWGRDDSTRGPSAAEGTST
ncbi:glycosyltransferase [Jiangella alkaliphila]|uniref:4,4'-diaponeurosporenoate glycosyltransferase n=1 Tax=Jiangella alkaliphila TaxID=419479 RepID=A0A1H2J2P4_9ACTN|nr:glycosyltransferase [Jiangella alkaliphila]SDU50328.1 Glycosyltransferase involved in cell wall bisynthesis [Jiangella alkaliphila]